LAFPSCKSDREGQQGLILVPTRELAIQVETEISRIGKHTPIRSVPITAAENHRPDEIPQASPGVAGTRPGIDARPPHHQPQQHRFIVLDEGSNARHRFRDDIRNILTQARPVARRVMKDAIQAGEGNAGRRRIRPCSSQPPSPGNRRWPARMRPIEN
jgi:hypothetical protein